MNCFIILGLPGDSPDKLAYTIDLCEQYNARIRPTIYTPYNDIIDDLSDETLMQYNRQLFVDGTVSLEDAEQYYNLFYNRRYFKTPVRDGKEPPECRTG